MDGSSLLAVTVREWVKVNVPEKYNRWIGVSVALKP